jgi:hypothetical protein
MAPLSPADFLRLLEAHVRPMHVSFSRTVLQCFIESAWPLIEDDPDPAFWADRFLELGSAVEIPS